ncbi:MAG: hypothetical protein Q8O00_06810, partial [Holophaga sp.]|nr:hypothetical protein [Holophaga sp.]
WRRLGAGPGTLAAHPPMRMARLQSGKDSPPRSLSSLTELAWENVPETTDAWPPYDAAWAWKAEDAALTPWDLRWGKGIEGFPKEHHRQDLISAYRSEWLTASNLRASVRGWLPEGPDIALRETSEVAWVWVGDRVLMVRLHPSERLRKIRALLKSR